MFVNPISMSPNKKFVLIKFEADQSFRIVKYTDGKLNKILKYIEIIYGKNFTHKELNISDSIYEFKNLLDEYGFLSNNVSCIEEKDLAQHLKNLTKNYDKIMGIKGTIYKEDDISTTNTDSEVNNKSTPIDFFLNNDKILQDLNLGSPFDSIEEKSILLPSLCKKYMFNEHVVSDFEGASMVSDLEGAPVVSDLEGAPVVSDLEGAPVVSDLEGAPVVSDLEGAPVVNDFEGAPVVNDLEGAPVVSDLEGAPMVRDFEGASIVNDEPEAFDGIIFTPANVDFSINTPVDYELDEEFEEILDRKIEERSYDDMQSSSEDTYSVDFDSESDDTSIQEVEEYVIEDDIKIEDLENVSINDVPFTEGMRKEPKNPPLPDDIENVNYNIGWSEPPIPEGNSLESSVPTINPENDIYSRSFFTPKTFVSPWVQNTIDPNTSSKCLFDNNSSQESTLNVTGFNDDNYSVYCMVDQKFYCICLNNRIFKVYVFAKDIYHDLKEYFPEIELVKEVNIMNNRIDIVKKSFSDNYFTNKEDVEKELDKVLNPQPEKNQTPSKQQILDYIKSKFNIDGVSDKKTVTNDLIVRNIINDMYVKYSYRKVIEVAVPQILTELGLKRHGNSEWSGISVKESYSYKNIFDSNNTWFEIDKGEN